MATKNLQVKMQNSLSVGDYFKNYDLFCGAVRLGADLNNFEDTWIHYSSKVHKDLQEPI